MPKTVSTPLKAHIGGEVATLCTCWQLTRRDGVALYFTDHDQDLVIDGHTFVASLGYTRSAMTTNVDFSVDNVQLAGIITDDRTLTEDDIRSGLYDFAELRMFMVNWADLTMGQLRLRRGRLGDISSTSNGIFQTQMNGMIQVLAHQIGEMYSGLCGADLGDARCKIDLTLAGGFLKDATVTTITDFQNFTIAVTEPRAVDGWFDQGVVTWVTGNNAGRSIEVKSWFNAAGSVVLFLPMPRPIQIGDTLTIYPGCDKRPSTCRDKFDNILNNRSFPFIPGPDAILASPPSLT